MIRQTRTMKKHISALLLALLIFCTLPALAADHKAYPLIEDSAITPTPSGYHHYMLICLDGWNTDWVHKMGYHTDGLILVTVDSIGHRVMLTSFIRDMLIVRPDGEWGRINNLFYLNGQNEKALDSLLYTINRHFDLNIEKYIVVDFSSVEKIVDAVGGVDITITADEARRLKSYNFSSSSTTPELAGAGTYHFKGHAAVIYMRIRKEKTITGASNEIGRTERARTVLSTIADSLSDITYDEALDLLDVIMDRTLITNMTAGDYMTALDLAMQFKGTPIQTIRMPVDKSYHPDPEAGMATQWIDLEMNREALRDFLYGSEFAVLDE